MQFCFRGTKIAGVLNLAIRSPSVILLSINQVVFVMYFTRSEVHFSGHELQNGESDPTGSLHFHELVFRNEHDVIPGA